MTPFSILDDQWPFVLKMFCGVDLEASAREQGAIHRKRVISTGPLLLRLALVYALSGFSLRQTAAWACQKGLAEFSDVALLKRLRSAGPWMGWLLAHLLSERAQKRGLQGLPRRVRLVDATTVSRPGSRGTDWRAHLSWDLQASRIDSVELTGAEGGETLSRFPISPGDWVVGDRGYAHRRGLHWVWQSQGHFLVRFHPQNLPLQDRQGQPWEVLPKLRQDPQGEFWEFEVQTAPDAKRKIPALPVRLIILRKTPAATEKARQKILREAKRTGRRASPEALEAAEYMMVVTSIPQPELEAHQALELYRFRWQIEIAFKRLKGLLELDELPAKDPRLAQTFLLAKLLAALLLEDLTDRYLAFSPWGYPLPAGAITEPMADPADPARGLGPCPDGDAQPSGTPTDPAQTRPILVGSTATTTKTVGRRSAHPS